MQEYSNIEVFETEEALNKGMAELIIAKAAKAIALRNRFVLCLSGGNTPQKLYKLLATELYRTQIDWQKTFVFWGDERCVPATDSRNNAYMAKTTLLNKVDIPSANIYAIESELAPDNAAHAYELKLYDFFKNSSPRFDLILLGLGEDGHTASLLPNTPALNETHRLATEVYHEQQKTFRVTLTLPAINAGRIIVFFISGSGKAAILKTLIQHSGTDTIPAQLVQPVSGQVLIYTDSKAASLL